MSTRVHCDRCNAHIRGGQPNQLILRWQIGDDATITKDLCADCMRVVDKLRVEVMKKKARESQ